MKGFKPTGYGPSAGFKFPSSFGFTGSTGGFTNVSPYVRRKFANGGMVTSEPGDQGSALVRRSKPTTELDAESGGRSPLRPGFKKGGKMRKADGGSVSSKRANPQPAGSRQAPKMKLPATALKSKFYADGGEVEKPTYTQAVKDRIRELLRMPAENSSGLAKKAADKMSGRQRQIDRAVDEAVEGKGNYAFGGGVNSGLVQRALKSRDDGAQLTGRSPTTRLLQRALAQAQPRPTMVTTPSRSMPAGRYAKGGNTRKSMKSC